MIVALAILAAQAGFPQIGLSRAAIPAGGTLVGLFQFGDYPIEARRNREEGTVVFRVDVSAKGKVTGCSIVQSSGSPSLDARTCEVASKRARFTPAKDETGRPVASTYGQRIHWSLPQGGSSTR